MKTNLAAEINDLIDVQTLHKRNLKTSKLQEETSLDPFINESRFVLNEYQVFTKIEKINI
jgi:hypothetical protein